MGNIDLRGDPRLLCRNSFFLESWRGLGMVFYFCDFQRKKGEVEVDMDSRADAGVGVGWDRDIEAEEGVFLLFKKDWDLARYVEKMDFYVNEGRSEEVRLLPLEDL